MTTAQQKAPDRTEAETWALAVFEKSVLKQAKWRALSREVGETMEGGGLDLGSDNGVVSLLLRRLGGSWRSADLDPVAVASIRSLVGDPVELLEGPKLPYEDASFEVVVVVDMLEHLDDDAALASELARVLKPNGRLVVNVPHIKRFSPLRRLRLMLGLTDSKHGHVRPGYTRKTLGALLEPHFEGLECRSYVGPFSELIDIALSWAFERKKGGAPASSKGAVLTADNAATMRKSLKLYSLVYPFFQAFSALDRLVAFLPGCMLAGQARKRRA